MQIGPGVVAVLGALPRNGVTGFVFAKRKSPTGGCAKGMLRYSSTCAAESLLPTNIPCEAVCVTAPYAFIIEASLHHMSETMIATIDIDEIMTIVVYTRFVSLTTPSERARSS